MVRASLVSCGLAAVSSAIDSAVGSVESGSILQITRQSSMNVAAADGPPDLSEAWFIAEVEGFQATADTLSENFDASHGQIPNKDLLKTARDYHNLCRVEQLDIVRNREDLGHLEDSKKEDCDHMQSMYEKAVCASDQSCRECHTGASQRIVQLKLMESSNRALYVLVWGKQKCEVKNHRDGTNVECGDVQPEQPLPSVTYPSEPDVACASPSTLPGGPGWSIAEYQSQNWSKLLGGVVKVADVSPCLPAPGTQTKFVKRTDAGVCRYVGRQLYKIASGGGSCLSDVGVDDMTDVECAAYALSYPNMTASLASKGRCYMYTSTQSAPTCPLHWMSRSAIKQPEQLADREYEGVPSPNVVAVGNPYYGYEYFCQIFGEHPSASSPSSPITVSDTAARLSGAA